MRPQATRRPMATSGSQKYPSWWHVPHTTKKLTHPAHDTWWLKRATSMSTAMPTPHTSTRAPNRSCSQWVMGNSRIRIRYTMMNQSGLKMSFTARGTPSRSYRATATEPMSHHPKAKMSAGRARCLARYQAKATVVRKRPFSWPASHASVWA